jgi:hypothetical protein
MSISWLPVPSLMIVSAWLAAGCGGANGLSQAKDVGGPCVLSSDCNQPLVCATTTHTCAEANPIDSRGNLVGPDSGVSGSAGVSGAGGAAGTGG